MNERRLAARLEQIRQDPVRAAQLRPIDRHGLLPQPPATVEEVFHDKSMEALLEDEDAADIFDVSALPRRELPEYIAKRVPCRNFELFRELFARCQRELNEGKRHTSRVANGQKNVLEQGNFVLLKGMLAYIADKGETMYNRRKERNNRLRVIFENGTEADLLMRSLFCALYDGGRLVSEPDETELKLEGSVNEDDCLTGCVYVLKSASRLPEVRAIPHLYKIGVSSVPLEERIAHARHEATYLMADVIPVRKWDCYNLDARKAENLLHHFFAAACLDLEIRDGSGRLCRPREWFSVPLGIIEQVIPLLLDGSIIHYRYDPESMTLEKRAGDGKGR